MAAQSDSTVPIPGAKRETGKELIARAIHNLSGRSGRRMVKMNCAAMAGCWKAICLVMSAARLPAPARSGLAVSSWRIKSSLFLDEVGDMPLEQPAAARPSQEQEFETCLGSNKLIQTDVRLIAATNRDLKNGRRSRIPVTISYYRLNVFPIQLPPLRERLGRYTTTGQKHSPSKSPAEWAYGCAFCRNAAHAQYGMAGERSRTGECQRRC